MTEEQLLRSASWGFKSPGKPDKRPRISRLAQRMLSKEILRDERKTWRWTEAVRDGYKRYLEEGER